MPTDRHPELDLDVDSPPEDGSGRLQPVHLRLRLLAWVALGGFVGTWTRYQVARWEPSHRGRWPLGTFVVNVLGCLVLGALMEALARAGSDEGWRLRARLLLGTGFCGALTTYSTLAVESDLLARDHRFELALSYLVASLLTGLVATAGGIAAAAAIHRRGRDRGVS